MTTTTELVKEAQTWLVEHGYGSSAADMLSRLADALEATTAAPPTGWATLGTHVGFDGALEFSTQVDEDGLPLWERPATAAPSDTDLREMGVRGWIVVDKTTNALDWDGELHLSEEAARASLEGDRRFNDPDWKPFEIYDILPVLSRTPQPSDTDQRSRLIETLRDTRCIATPRLEHGYAKPVPEEAERIADALLPLFSRTPQPSVDATQHPGDDERTPEFEALEQELFKHQPVLSMRDGSISGCQCMERVFHKRSEDWGTHLAEVFEALRRPVTPDTEGTR